MKVFFSEVKKSDNGLILESNTVERTAGDWVTFDTFENGELGAYRIDFLKTHVGWSGVPGQIFMVTESGGGRAQPEVSYVALRAGEGWRMVFGISNVAGVDFLQFTVTDQNDDDTRSTEAPSSEYAPSPDDTIDSLREKVEGLGIRLASALEGVRKLQGRVALMPAPCGANEVPEDTQTIAEALDDLVRGKPLLDGHFELLTRAGFAMRSLSGAVHPTAAGWLYRGERYVAMDAVEGGRGQKSQIEALQRQRDEARARAEASEKKLEETKSTLARVRECEARIADELRDARSKFAEQDKTILSLKGKLDEAREHREQAIAQEKHGESIEERDLLQTRNEALREELSKSSEALSTCRHYAHESDKENQSLRTQLIAARADIEAHETASRRLQEFAKEQTETGIRVVRELDETRALLAAEKSNSAQVSEVLESTQEKMQRAVRRIEILEACRVELREALEIVAGAGR